MNEIEQMKELVIEVNKARDEQIANIYEYLKNFQKDQSVLAKRVDSLDKYKTEQKLLKRELQNLKSDLKKVYFIHETT